LGKKSCFSFPHSERGLRTKGENHECYIVIRRHIRCFSLYDNAGLTYACANCSALLRVSLKVISVPPPPPPLLLVGSHSKESEKAEDDFNLPSEFPFSVCSCSDSNCKLTENSNCIRREKAKVKEAGISSRLDAGGKVRSNEWPRLCQCGK